MDLKTLNKNDSLDILKSLKPHINQEIVSKSFDSIMEFDLFGKTIADEKINDIEKLETLTNDKAKGLMDIYENFEKSSNRLFILGSLDYFRIVLKQDKVNDINKADLLHNLYDYAEKVEKEYFKNYSTIDSFAYLDLNELRSEFDVLEEYVSSELEIMPKFDENSDLSILLGRDMMNRLKHHDNITVDAK